ncbi:MAG: hypothetical protein AAF497_18945, partial [Planctomycetota bacterium]
MQDSLELSIERLEDRTMLAVDFVAIADTLQTSGSLIDDFVVEQSNRLQDNFAPDQNSQLLALPLLDQTIGEVVNVANTQASNWAQPVTDALQSIGNFIADENSLDPNANEQQIATAVFDALAGAGFGDLLQNYDLGEQDFGLRATPTDDSVNQTEVGFAGAAADQIVVQKQGDDVQISLTLGVLSPDLIGDTQVAVDIGLPSLPLFNMSASDIDLHLGVLVQHLTFGIINDQPFIDFVDLDSSNDDVADGVTIFTHASFDESDDVLSGQLGFLHLGADDVKKSNGIGSALAMGFEFASGWDNTAQGFVRPGDVRMVGGLDVNLQAELEFVDGDDSFPAIGSEFFVDWSFDQQLSAASPLSNLAEFGDAPSVGFSNVQLELGGYVSQVIGPVVDVVQTVAAPLQPLIDVLTTPIPLLSDLAEWLDFADGSDLSLNSILKTLDSTDLLPPQYDALIGLFTSAVSMLQFVDDVEEDANGNGYMMSFGDFELTGNDGTLDIRSVTAAIDPANGGLANVWSSLAPDVTRL